MNKKSVKFLCINAIFLFLSFLTTVLYLEFEQPYLFKTVASFTFVLCALYNLFFALKNNKKEKAFPSIMFFGQFFAMLGDIVLIDNFIIGAILFAMGHVLFFVAYLSVKGFELIDIALAAVMVGATLCIIFTNNIELGTMAPIIIGYAVIISFMLAKSITVLLKDKFLGYIVIVGSLMFFLSDMALLFKIFGSGAKIFDILCLVLYYPAEFVLAFSIGASALKTVQNPQAKIKSDSNQ